MGKRKPNGGSTVLGLAAPKGCCQPRALPSGLLPRRLEQRWLLVRWMRRLHRWLRLRLRLLPPSLPAAPSGAGAATAAAADVCTWAQAGAEAALRLLLHCGRLLPRRLLRLRLRLGLTCLHLRRAGAEAATAAAAARRLLLPRRLLRLRLRIRLIRLRRRSHRSRLGPNGSVPNPARSAFCKFAGSARCPDLVVVVIREVLTQALAQITHGLLHVYTPSCLARFRSRRFASLALPWRCGLRLRPPDLRWLPPKQRTPRHN